MKANVGNNEGVQSTSLHEKIGCVYKNQMASSQLGGT